MYEEYRSAKRKVVRTATIVPGSSQLETVRLQLVVHATSSCQPSLDSNSSSTTNQAQ